MTRSPTAKPPPILTRPSRTPSPHPGLVSGNSSRGGNTPVGSSIYPGGILTQANQSKEYISPKPRPSSKDLHEIPSPNISKHRDRLSAAPVSGTSSPLAGGILMSPSNKKISSDPRSRVTLLSSHSHSNMEAGMSSGRSTPSRQKSLIRPERSRSRRSLSTRIRRNTITGFDEAGYAASPDSDNRSTKAAKQGCCKAFQIWTTAATCLTCWACDCCLIRCGGRTDSLMRQAWREKTALCLIIFVSCLALGFLTFGLSTVVCRPPSFVYKHSSIAKKISGNERWFIIHGYIYNIPDKYQPFAHPSMQVSPYSALAGTDVTVFFPYNPTCSRAGFSMPLACQSPKLPGYQHCHPTDIIRDLDRVGQVTWDWAEIENSTQRFSYNGYVLDIGYYLDQVPKNSLVFPFGRDLDALFRSSVGGDATKALQGYPPATIRCLLENFGAGTIDIKSVGCILTDIILYVSLVCILAVILVKFLLAVFFTIFFSRRLGDFQAKKLERTRRKQQKKEEQETAAALEIQARELEKSNFAMRDSLSSPRNSSSNIPNQEDFAQALNQYNFPETDKTAYGSVTTASQLSLPYPNRGRRPSLDLEIGVHGNQQNHSRSSLLQQPAGGNQSGSQSFGSRSSGTLPRGFKMFLSSSRYSAAQIKHYAPRTSFSNTRDELGLFSGGGIHGSFSEQSDQLDHSANPSWKSPSIVRISGSNLHALGQNQTLSLPAIIQTPSHDGHKSSLPYSWVKGANNPDSLNPSNYFDGKDSGDKLLGPGEGVYPIRLDSTLDPDTMYTLLVVTCYSEGETGLKSTIDSLVATDYPDNQKLLFIVADGIVHGAGNAKSTPELLVDLMEVDRTAGYIGNYPWSHFVPDVSTTKEDQFGGNLDVDSKVTFANNDKELIAGLDNVTEEKRKSQQTSKWMSCGRKSLEVSDIYSDRWLPPPLSYVAIADGSKRHNRARIFAGHYRSEGHCVPALVIVKVGTEEEESANKPGNRGKRDSQIILMSFLSKILFRDRMTPLEYDLCVKMQYLLSTPKMPFFPDQFEVTLCVDADTVVSPACLSHMTSVMKMDPLVMGLCGETKIANKSQSWVTAIQVFEYFISHHLNKAFESIFGGVTCLPGCFCMYRIKAPKGPLGSLGGMDGGGRGIATPNQFGNSFYESTVSWVPVLASPDIVNFYAENVTDTLHKKNLLLLGEDRYLTTLLLRTFPKRKMVFVPTATCQTMVPDTFSVLLSQRRRWINSTVHNLFELVLVQDLCGTFCCSMQFIIFMELIGTLVLPAAILFTGVLLVNSFVGSDVQWIPLGLLVAILGLPAFLILFTARSPTYGLYMIAYLISLPIWNFVLPVYAYWHFDDFSWGETRKVEKAAPPLPSTNPQAVAMKKNRKGSHSKQTLSEKQELSPWANLHKKHSVDKKSSKSSMSSPIDKIDGEDNRNLQDIVSDEEILDESFKKDILSPIGKSGPGSPLTIDSRHDNSRTSSKLSSPSKKKPAKELTIDIPVKPIRESHGDKEGEFDSRAITQKYWQEYELAWKSSIFNRDTPFPPSE